MTSQGGPRERLVGDLTWGLAELWRKKAFTDLVLVAGGKYVPCHRAVLAAVSPYFHGRLHNGRREMPLDKLFLPTVSRLVIANVLDFIYTGKCRLAKDNVEAVLKAASMFQIASLVDLCDSFLAQTVTAKNALKMFKMATSKGCKKLESATRGVILNNFMALAQTKGFLSLSRDQLISIIREDGLCVPSEDFVCDAVMAWANFDIQNRKNDLAHVLKNVRLPNVPKSYIRHSLEQNDVILDSPECGELLGKVKALHSDPGRRPELHDQSLTFRDDARMDDVIMIIGGSAANDSNRNCQQSVVCFNMALKKWFHMAPLPFGYDSGACVCPVGLDVYVAGGGDRRQGLTVYRGQENAWEVLPNLLIGRRGHAMVALGPWLFVLGGVLGHTSPGKIQVTTAVEAFHTERGQWEACGVLVVGVWGASAVVHDDVIYVLGGYVDRDRPTDIIQAYDSRTRQCTIVGSLPFPCGLTRAVVCNGDYFVISPTGVVMRSTTCKQFAIAATIPNFTRAMFGAVMYEGHILLVGGKYCSEVFDDMQLLDVQHLTLSSMKERLFRPIWGFACVKATVCRRHLLKSEIRDLDCALSERPLSAQDRPSASNERPVSPKERPQSPKERPLSPKERPFSPKERPFSPKRRPFSPKRPMSPKGPSSPRSSRTPAKLAYSFS